MKTLYSRLFLVAVLLGLLAGCAGLGLAPAQSTEQKLAYSYGTVSALRTSAAQALTAGTISVGDAKKVLVDTDAAKAALDAGKAALASGTADSTSVVANNLAIATGILTQVQAFLTSKGVK